MMRREPPEDASLDYGAMAFYGDVIDRLCAASVSFLIGGGWALQCYTGMAQRTKDLDLFLRETDVAAAIRILREAGYEAELASPVWLAKVLFNEHLVDLVFNAACQCSGASG